MTQIEQVVPTEIRERILQSDTIVFDLYRTLFDLEDTIAERVEGLNKGINSKIFTDGWIREYGRRLDIPNEESWIPLDQIIHAGLTETISALNLEKFTQEERKRLVDAWLHPKPFDDTKEFLLKLKSLGIPIGTMSNASRQMQEEIISTLGQGCEFDLFFTPDEVRVFKPHSKIYEQVYNTETQSRKPKIVTMFTNSIGDLKGARNAGMNTVYIYRDNGVVSSDLSFDVIAHDLREFSARLRI